MKITISSLGKFHAFHLASQLDKRGHLEKLLTCFYSQKRGFLPEFRVDKEVIDLEKVITNPLPLIIQKVLNRSSFTRKLARWDYYTAELYDYWARDQVGKCDICTAWSGTALYTLRRAKELGAKTIVERGSSHIVFQKEILEEEYEKWGIKAKPVDERTVEKELREYEEADFISVPSSFVKRTFLEKGIKEEKLIHVPYGVDLTHFKQVKKKDNVFRIIFCGGISIRKGLPYLLQAFSELKLKNSELCLIGSISPEMISIMKKYEGIYKHLGHIPQAELYKYFSSGSVFILPSLEEGFGMVIPQAMACGLPVICTTNTGGEDIVRTGVDGFIIPIRDVPAIKEKILKLYNDDTLRLEMGKNAKERVSSGFTWDDYGEKLISHYKNINV